MERGRAGPEERRRPRSRAPGPSGGRRRTALVVAAFALGLPGCPPGSPAPGSRLVGCERAAERVVLDADAHLDPSCVYTGGFEIPASGVELDCRGAHLRGAPEAGGRGIEIRAPEGQDLADVTVRNCHVEGFLNGVRVTREGFRSLAPGEEYRNGTRDIVIERSSLRDAHGVGLFVDGYVSGVTIRDNVVAGAGSAGIYLESGSRRNHVEHNLLLDNGHRENGPGGQRFRLLGVDVWFWGVGREGIAVDGSYENTIQGNVLSGNRAGGIFSYENCGEFPDRPSFFERRFPASDNRITGNVFLGGPNGVWLGSRMGENTFPMACSKPAYLEGPLFRVVLDRAANNTVAGNLFQGVAHGVRVEDDGTEVVGNVFVADAPDHHAVLIGTPHRTEALGRPVRGTVVLGNVSAIAGNASPYRWAHGHEDTVFGWNLAEGRRAGLCEGEPVPRQLLIFTLAFGFAAPDGTPPPAPPDLAVPTLGPLPPCE